MLNIPYSAAKQLLQDPDTLAVPLCLLLEEAVGDAEMTYGPDAIDPSTAFQVLEDKYDVTLLEAARNRLQAILLLRATELFESDPDAFTAVALAFVDGQIGDMFAGVVEPITATEALWAIIEASIVDPHMRDMQRPVASFIDDLLEEPTEESEEEDTDLLDMLEVLKGQLQVLRVPDEFYEKLMVRISAVMNSVAARFGEEALISRT